MNELSETGDYYLDVVTNYYKGLTKKELLDAIANILQQRDIVIDMLLNDTEHSDEFLHDVGIGCALNIELRAKKRRSAK